MTKRNIIYKAILIFIISVSGVNFANATQDIKIAGGAINGIYHSIALQICDLINKHSTTARCQTLSTDGSINNIDLLQSGKVDFALVQSDVVMDAKYSKGFFLNKAPALELRVVFSLFPEVFSILVKDEKQINNFSEVAGYKIGINLGSSGVKNGLLSLLKYYRFKNEPELVHTEDNELADKICDNTLDVVVLFMANPNNIADKITNNCDVEFLSIDDMQLEHLLVENPTYERFVVPSKFYSKIAHPANTFATRSLLVTNANVNRIKVNTITEVINEHFDEFKKSSPILFPLDKQSLKYKKSL